MRSRAAKATISSHGNVRDEEYAEEAAVKSSSVSINARSNETNPTTWIQLLCVGIVVGVRRRAGGAAAEEHSCGAARPGAVEYLVRRGVLLGARACGNSTNRLLLAGPILPCTAKQTA